MHPACNRLPEYISYHGHSIHPLRLEAGPAEVCSTCSHVCTSWRYRCGTCGFNIHLGCMSAPPSSPPPPIPSPFYAGTVGIPPPGYAGIGAPTPNYAVYNNNPQPYVNASQYASGSSGAFPSNGKSNFGQMVGSAVGGMAISIVLETMI